MCFLICHLYTCMLLFEPNKYLLLLVSFATYGAIQMCCDWLIDWLNHPAYISGRILTSHRCSDHGIVQASVCLRGCWSVFAKNDRHYCRGIIRIGDFALFNVQTTRELQQLQQQQQQHALASVIPGYTTTTTRNPRHNWSAPLHILSTDPQQVILCTLWHGTLALTSKQIPVFPVAVWRKSRDGEIFSFILFHCMPCNVTQQLIVNLIDTLIE